MSAKSEGHMARHMGSRNLSLGNRWEDDWAYRRVAKPGRLIRNKWFGSETGRHGMLKEKDKTLETATGHRVT
ncbi:hypothetical protein BO85DRAFT_486312 [Aspergillus piperis CBS 112811]|uniref:Uncharacterized protein n=1 Tax=Aspergillus piperis CBS 112811 TaxID=1448313 RepID=A0A8G1VRK5_9EURO|nr:hypothetical protein BO85DRAFT_486312 [Aspergillus piperis CBS 112811]RAH59858.1 hypothetical protein BO85DRAFT_486312 [Aspergillus piperis CBS 112811]